MTSLDDDDVGTPSGARAVPSSTERPANNGGHGGWVWGMTIRLALIVQKFTQFD